MPALLAFVVGICWDKALVLVIWLQVSVSPFKNPACRGRIHLLDLAQACPSYARVIQQIVQLQQIQAHRDM